MFQKAGARAANSTGTSEPSELTCGARVTLAVIAPTSAGETVARAPVRWTVASGSGASVSDSVTYGDGNGRAEVALEFGPGERWVGTAEGLASDAGELRCAAEAALRAIELSAHGQVAFELLGVKAIRG